MGFSPFWSEEFSELIRTGGLDFALLKPIDTQFLISLQKVEWSSLSNFIFAAGLLAFSLFKLEHPITLVQVILYPLYIACGIAILYSLMIGLASTSIWLFANSSTEPEGKPRAKRVNFTCVPPNRLDT